MSQSAPPVCNRTWIAVPELEIGRKSTFAGGAAKDSAAAPSRSMFSTNLAATSRTPTSECGAVRGPGAPSPPGGPARCGGPGAHGDPDWGHRGSWAWPCPAGLPGVPAPLGSWVIVAGGQTATRPSYGNFRYGNFLINYHDFWAITFSHLDQIVCAYQ